MAELLRAPARLTCPRCGYVFDIRPAAPPPVALPVPTAVVTDDLNFSAPPGPRRGGRSPRQKAVVAGVAVGGALLLFLAIGFVVSNLRKRSDRSGSSTETFNFSTRRLDAVWQPNDSQLLGCKWSWQRDAPVCILAIDVEDHEKGFPKEAALMEGVAQRLDKYLTAVTWRPKPPSTRDHLLAQGSLDGQPCYVFDFDGQRKQTSYVGECHVLEHRGFVYWVFTLSPAPNDDEGLRAVRRYWNSGRDGFQLLNRREGWMPR